MNSGQQDTKLFGGGVFSYNVHSSSWLDIIPVSDSLGYKGWPVCCLSCWVKHEKIARVIDLSGGY